MKFHQLNHGRRLVRRTCSRRLPLATALLGLLSLHPVQAGDRPWELTITASRLYDDHALLSANVEENRIASDSEALQSGGDLQRRSDEADRLDVEGSWILAEDEGNRYWLDGSVQNIRYLETSPAYREIYTLGLSSYHLRGPWQLRASASVTWSHDNVRLFQFDKNLSLTGAYQSGDYSREGLTLSGYFTDNKDPVTDSAYDPDSTYLQLSMNHLHYLPHLLIEGQYSVVSLSLVAIHNNAKGYYYDSRGGGVGVSLSQPLGARDTLSISYHLRSSHYTNPSSTGNLRDDLYRALTLGYSHILDEPAWRFSVTNHFSRNDSNLDGDLDYRRNYLLLSVSRSL